MHEANMDDTIRENILAEAIKFVPEGGWSAETLAAGAIMAGYPGTTHGMFPRGGVELAHYFYSTCNKQHETILKSEEFTNKPRNEFLKDAIKSRLEMYIPLIDNWPQVGLDYIKAMALMSVPTNIPESLENLKTLMDNIWYHAGDTSTDGSWYSKRIGLSMVYKTTELCLIQDKSQDFHNTWQFLDRRIKNLETARNFREETIKANQQLFNFIEGGSIVVKNILGLQK